MPGRTGGITPWPVAPPRCSSSNRSVSHTPSAGPSRLRRLLPAPIRSKGGEPTMTFSEWFEFAKANFRKEEGQTMAEYGVVLAVITLGIVATLGLLSGGIKNALNGVISFPYEARFFC